MINQEELQEYIAESIPELSGICREHKCSNAHDIAREMIQYTNRQFIGQNIASAKECLALAENLYKSGNKVVRNAIENVFVYSFSHSFFCDEQKKKGLLAILPTSLYVLYKQQLLASHL